MTQSDEIKKVFISYSWSDQSRVLQIVEKLRSNGVDTLMDVHDMGPGTDKYQFMEKSVNDPSVDYVLVFSSSTYAKKADERKGGVGDETQILSGDAYNLNANKVQVILLERGENKSECLPTYLRNKKYFDFSTPENEQIAYEDLLRFIYDKPQFKKPKLGTKPSFLDEENVDLYPLREELSRLPIGGTRRFSRFIDLVNTKILETIGVVDINRNNYVECYGQLQNIRELCIDYVVRYYENEGSISDISIRLIESVRNCFHINSQIKMDLLYSFTHELLICLVALTIYYDEIDELKTILTNRFEVKNFYNQGLNYVTFHELYYNSSFFEWINVEEKRNKINLHAEQMINRLQYPYITKETLSTADLIMYHLCPIVSKDSNYWFPLLYHYFEGGIKLWARLISRSYLEKFERTFSINKDELIPIVNNCPYDDTRHPHSFERAPWISKFIDSSKIGTDL